MPLMANRLDEILVIDVESTCWEGAQPHDQISEIIEVGLCTVNIATLERTEKRSILVKPIRSKVSDFCTQLTTLTAEELAQAKTLNDALNILRSEYYSRTRLWASWGDYDRKQFQRNCEAFGLNYPFGRGHLNVKTLYAVTMGLSRVTGLDIACKQLDLPMEGRHHRGVDDAWNIAAILCKMLKILRPGLQS